MQRRSKRPQLPAGLTAALTACALAAGGCSCELPVPDPAEFEIGQGERRFERLDQSGYKIVNGASGQGGGSRHVWVAVGCASCGGFLVVSLSGTDPDTGAALAFPSSSLLSFEACTEQTVSWGWVAGLRLQLDDSVPAPSDDDVTVHVEISTEAGDAVGVGEVTTTISGL